MDILASTGPFAFGGGIFEDKGGSGQLVVVFKSIWLLICCDVRINESALANVKEWKMVVERVLVDGSDGKLEVLVINVYVLRNHHALLQDLGRESVGR